MAEPSASESSADSDQDFDPTAEMLVNDFDDEHTLEEEEAMESADSVTNELDDLQREGEMPLEQLLAMYGYGSGETGNSTATKYPSTRESPVQPEQQQPPVKEALMVPVPPIVEREETIVPDDAPDNPPGSGPLLRSVSQASESSDTGTDDDYSPDDDWRKTIQVGSDYQAVIPEGLCKYDDAPAYENEDRLLWDPAKLPDQEVEDYLRQTQQPFVINSPGVNAIPIGSHIRDDEQALFLLLQCGHNVEEALRRRRMQPLHLADTMSLWSEDECRSFETGLRTYGKDFHLIQQNKVRTRSVGELVQFYYLWKKTERHDVFASKNRLEKKKYALHPGTTDYMDRFLDEQENPSTHRDRSSSPSMHSLIFGENRKRTPASSPPANVSKTDPMLDVNTQQGNHTFLDVSYSTGVERTMHLHSPNSKIHSGNPLSDCSKEFLNGEDRISSVASPKDRGPCLSTDLQTVHMENLSSHLLEKNSSNPPTDILSCTRHSTETSRLHDSRSDTCNTRFETRREEVASIE